MTVPKPKLPARVTLGIRAKLSIVTGFFVATIILIVSVISLSRQYRSLTESQERELGPIRAIVERLVLDMEGMSNTLLLVEEFRARVREKAAELSRYRQQETEVVTRWSEFAEKIHEMVSKSTAKQIEAGTMTKEKAGQIKSDMDSFARTMSERSPLFKKIVMQGEETRVVYRDTYFSQYLDEAKIREIEDGVRRLMVDEEGRPAPDAVFRALQRHAAAAVEAERRLRDETVRLQDLEQKAAGDNPEIERLRNGIIALAARREEAMAALNGGLQSFLRGAQKKRLLELGLDTGAIRIQLFTVSDRKPGFDTGIFSDGKGINAAAFLDDPALDRAIAGAMKARTSTAWPGDAGGPARIRRGERTFDVSLRPVIRTWEVASRARLAQEAFDRDPDAWKPFIAEDAGLAAEFRACAEKIGSRLAQLRRTGMRPADDRQFRDLYAAYGALLARRGESVDRHLSRLRPSPARAVRDFFTGAAPADRGALREALLNLRDAALHDYGMLRAGAGPGPFAASLEPASRRDAEAARWRALREWIMRGESETRIPAATAGGMAAGVFEGGVMSRSRSELEEEMWRLDATPLGAGGGLAKDLYADGVAGLTRTLVDITEGRARIFSGMLSLVYAAGALGAAAVLLALFLSTLMVRNIETISAKAARVGGGDLSVSFDVDSGDEIGALAATLNEMVHGLVERERAASALGRFVNTQVAEQVLRGELKLGGERKECAILFADIRGFTSMSELMEPEQVVEFLNEYMTALVGCLDRTGGVVDKFIGDAVMVTWGAAFSTGNDPENAVTTALLMRAAIAGFNARRGTEQGPPVRIGIGLSFGPVVAGQIGSEERLEYTVIGDTVNLASRIEALTKEFGCDILISEALRDRVQGIFRLERMREIKIKGKNDPQTLYAVLGRHDDPDAPRTMDELRKRIGLPGINA